MVLWSGMRLKTQMRISMSDSAAPNLTSPFASAFSNAYQTKIPSQINLPCMNESGSASTHAYNHAAPNLNSALPNLTSSFTYVFPNAYQTAIPSHINLPYTIESSSASMHAYNHALVSDSA